MRPASRKLTTAPSGEPGQDAVQFVQFCRQPVVLPIIVVGVFAVATASLEHPVGNATLSAIRWAAVRAGLEQPGRITAVNSHGPFRGNYADVFNAAWRVLPDAPHARDHFQAAVVDNKLYAFAGRRSEYKTGNSFEFRLKVFIVF